MGMHALVQAWRVSQAVGSVMYIRSNYPLHVPTGCPGGAGLLAGVQQAVCGEPFRARHKHGLCGAVTICAILDVERCREARLGGQASASVDHAFSRKGHAVIVTALIWGVHWSHRQRLLPILSFLPVLGPGELRCCDSLWSTGCILCMRHGLACALTFDFSFLQQSIWCCGPRPVRERRETAGKTLNLHVGRLCVPKEGAEVL